MSEDDDSLELDLNAKSRIEVSMKGKIKRFVLNPLSVINAFRRAARQAEDEGQLHYSTVTTENGEVVEKIVSSEIGLQSAREGEVPPPQLGRAHFEETEMVEAEQIVTKNIEEETKTLVRCKSSGLRLN